MGGFTILDPLEYDQEYSLLLNVCKWISLRLFMKPSQRDEELFTNYQNLSIKYNVSYHKLLDKCPSLKSIAYYFYLGDLPENILDEYSSEIKLGIGEHIHVISTIKISKFDGKIVGEIDENNLVDVEDLSNNQVKSVNVKNIVKLKNRYRQIYFENVEKKC